VLRAYVRAGSRVHRESVHSLWRIGPTLLHRRQVQRRTDVRQQRLFVAKLREHGSTVLHGRLVRRGPRVQPRAMHDVRRTRATLLSGRDVPRWTLVHDGKLHVDDHDLWNARPTVLHGRRVRRRHGVHFGHLHDGRSLWCRGTSVLRRQCMQCRTDVLRWNVHGGVRCHGADLLRRLGVQRGIDVPQRGVHDDVRRLRRIGRSVLYGPSVQRRTLVLGGRRVCWRNGNVRGQRTSVLQRHDVQYGTGMQRRCVLGEYEYVREPGTDVLLGIRVHRRRVLQRRSMHGVRSRRTDVLPRLGVQCRRVLQRGLVHCLWTRRTNVLPGLGVLRGGILQRRTVHGLRSRVANLLSGVGVLRGRVLQCRAMHGVWARRTDLLSGVGVQCGGVLQRRIVHGVWPLGTDVLPGLGVLRGRVLQCRPVHGLRCLGTDVLPRFGVQRPAALLGGPLRVTGGTTVDATAADDARLLRYGVAFVWLATGVLVVHPAYRSEGVSSLRRMHLPGILMYATCAFEVALAARVAFARSTAWLTWLQVGMIASFTVLLAMSEPWLLASPFGVLTKNVPIVACIVAAHRLEREGWTPRAMWILRAGVAAIWLTEGLGPKILLQQPVELAIAVRSGLSFGHPSAMLRAIGVAQVLSGLAALALRGRPLRILLGAQIAALVVLPLAVSWQLPLLWVHPFGPFTKNVPILVGTLVVLRRCPR